MNIGDRIRLLAMPNDPAPLPAGATGTIDAVCELRGQRCIQYGVKWDEPHERRALSVIVPPDQIERIG